MGLISTHMEEDGSLKANAKISNVGCWRQKDTADGSSMMRKTWFG